MRPRSPILLYCPNVDVAGRFKTVFNVRLLVNTRIALNLEQAMGVLKEFDIRAGIMLEESEALSETLAARRISQITTCSVGDMNSLVNTVWIMTKRKRGPRKAPKEDLCLTNP